MSQKISVLFSSLLFSLAVFAQNGTLTIRAYMDAPYGTRQNYAEVLWYDEVTDEYFVSKTPYSKPRKIFTFEQRDGGPSSNYSAALLPSGDVLFVYDSQFGAQVRGESYSEEDQKAPYTVALDNRYRKDPIIALARDGYSQHVIEFGERLKPTGWLQNVGQHWSYRYDAFYFAEYTRGNVRSCNGWKVSGDITDADNWKVKASRPIYFPYNYGTKHFHSAQEDPFTGAMYYTTGDRNAAIYSSVDGENFAQLDKDDRAKWRMLNAVYTRDYMWWASDDWKQYHHFWRCARAESGVIDPEKIEDLFFFPDLGPADCKATYGNIYFEKYNAILFLDRWDGGNKDYGDLPVYVYDIDSGRMIHLADLHRREGLSEKSAWGFRCRTMEMRVRGGKAVVSFDSYHPNDLYLPGNEDATNKVRNVIIALRRTRGGEYEMTFKPLIR